MTRYLKVCRSTAAALALLASAMAVSPSLADPIGGGHANIKSMSFNAESVNTTLHVISTDGQKWNKLKAGNIQFWGDMDLDTRWPGYTYEVGVVLGACGGALCNSFPAIFYAQPGSSDYHHQQNFTFSSSKIPVSTTGIAILPDGDTIISRCNEHLQADGPTKSHSFTYTMWATFIANTGSYINNTDNILYEASIGGGIPHPEGVDHSRKDTFDIQVVCDPVIKPATNDITYDFGEFDVENVKLFLTTITPLNPIQGNNPGTICPALRVTSRAETNKEGPVSMRIWRQKDGGPITSEFKQVWASYDAAKNGYFATYQFYEDVGATAYYQYKTEIVDGSVFPPFDGWKDITVHCTGAGGGGLTTTPPIDPDNPPPQASWDGEITIADSVPAGGNKSCPRKAQVSFEVTRDVPGEFDYRIGCSNGASFTGTATAFDQGNGVFMASAAHEINVNRTRTIQCTLQETKANGTHVTVDTDSMDFTCANRAIDPASNDLTVLPRPTTQKPTIPAVIVDPAPKCSKGFDLVRGRCVRKPAIVAACKRNEIRVNGKCIKKPHVSILCAPGFELKGKRCVRKPAIVAACKRNEIRVNGKCIKKPDVSILCAPGFELKGKRCVRKPVIVAACKRNEILVRGKCVKKPEVSILCKRGYKLVGKKCVRNTVLTTPKRLVSPKKVNPPQRLFQPKRTVKTKRTTPRKAIRMQQNQNNAGKLRRALR